MAEEFIPSLEVSLRPPFEPRKLYFFQLLFVLRVTNPPSPPAKKWPQSASKSSKKTETHPYEGVGAIVGDADGADVGEDDGENDVVGSTDGIPVGAELGATLGDDVFGKWRKICGIIQAILNVRHIILYEGDKIHTCRHVLVSMFALKTYRNGTRPITFGDRRLTRWGRRRSGARTITPGHRRLIRWDHRRPGTRTGRRGQLSRPPALDLDLIDVKIIVTPGRIGSEAEVRVTAGSGQGHDVKSRVLVVEIARRLRVAGIGRFLWGAAVLPAAELLPRRGAGLARRGVLRTVLHKEVLRVLEGADVPPELQTVDVVGGKVDVGGGQVEDGAGAHAVVVDEADGAVAQSEGEKAIRIESGIDSARRKVLPGAVVKVVGEYGGPFRIGGRSGLPDVSLGGAGPDEIVVEPAAGGASAAVENLEGSAETGAGHLAADSDGLGVGVGCFAAGAAQPFGAVGVGTEKSRGGEGRGRSGGIDVPVAGVVVGRLRRVGVGAASDLVLLGVRGEVAGFLRTGADAAALDEVLRCLELAAVIGGGGGGQCRRRDADEGNEERRGGQDAPVSVDASNGGHS